MTATLLLKPIDQGRLSSGYGVRYHPILKRRQMHLGIDWAAPRGTPVRAAGHGVVVAAGRFGAYGHYVQIDHGGAIATAYAHLERYAPGLRPGRAVRQGEPIGGVGSTGRATGPHLHYEVLIAGRQIDPLAFPPTVVARARSRAHDRRGVRRRDRRRRPRRAGPVQRPRSPCSPELPIPAARRDRGLGRDSGRRSAQPARPLSRRRPPAARSGAARPRGGRRRTSLSQCRRSSVAYRSSGRCILAVETH
jgi:Peptidase family M23